MRLADYTDKFFAFLAGTLRRLAEFLSVKPPTENVSENGEEKSSAAADWLEKTQNIPAENWIEFSSETTDFAEKTQKTSRTNANVFSNRKVSDKINSAALSESVFEEFSPPKEKKERRFLRFKFPSEKQSEKTSEKFKPLSKSAQTSLAEEKKMPVAPQKKYRLSASSPILDKKTKLAANSAPKVENYGEKSSENKPAISVVRRRKTNEKIEENVAPQSEYKIEVESRIFDKPVHAKTFSPENISRKNTSETTTRMPRVFPKKEAENVKTFKPKSQNAAEAAEFYTPWKQRLKTPPENFETKNKSATNDARDKFDFAPPPWMELPPENSPEAFPAGETSNSESEHLLYLEREHWGETSAKNH